MNELGKTITEVNVGHSDFACQALCETGDPAAHRHQFYFDIGTLFMDPDSFANRTSEAARMVMWFREHLQGNWAWSAPEWNRIGPDGRMLDVRKVLWISFDLSDDAVLARMTWLDLKGMKDADRRGLSPKNGGGNLGNRKRSRIVGRQC